MKMIRVAGLPGDYNYNGKKYRATTQPTEIPEGLAITLGLRELTGGETAPVELGQEAQLRQAQSDLLALQQEHTSLKADHARLSSEGEAKGEQITSLQEKLSRVEGERDTLQERTHALEAQLASAPKGTALQADFPGRAALEKAGLTTLEAVKFVQPEQLEAIEGIGKATFTKLQSALGIAPAGPENPASPEAPAAE